MSENGVDSKKTSLGRGIPGTYYPVNKVSPSRPIPGHSIVDHPWIQYPRGLLCMETKMHGLGMRPITPLGYLIRGYYIHRDNTSQGYPVFCLTGILYVRGYLGREYFARDRQAASVEYICFQLTLVLTSTRTILRFGEFSGMLTSYVNCLKTGISSESSSTVIVTVAVEMRDSFPRSLAVTTT